MFAYVIHEGKIRAPGGAMALIERLKPDVLIKGSDYTKDKVVGAAEVESWGGEVRLADFADGYSTTKTIEKMTGEKA